MPFVELSVEGRLLLFFTITTLLVRTAVLSKPSNLELNIIYIYYFLENMIRPFNIWAYGVRDILGIFKINFSPNSGWRPGGGRGCDRPRFVHRRRWPHRAALLHTSQEGDAKNGKQIVNWIKFDRSPGFEG